MSKLVDHSIEQMPLAQFTEKAYLDYSMYVILDRALPHIADGLKPVQRRIVYAMSELGLKHSAKFKKSARTVGDVLGKFHPHGDSACYEALVLMAQDFSYRYPLISGQGNFGSPDDPKSFAAMRYTESKLSAYAENLLSELDQGTVSWTANFDGTLEEPTLLPARLPNVLLNPTTGIAVGMATDIPSHNMKEVARACLTLLKNPNTSLDEICEIIPGPDLPTAAEIITPRNELKEMYRKGVGSFRQRAIFHVDKEQVILTALPYQVSPAKILEQIAAQMQNKKLPMVDDLRDESDHENPVRLVIGLRSNRIEVEPLMAHLFATTDLEKGFRVNFNLIGCDGKPRVKNLLEILKEWLSYRRQTIRLRLSYRLEKVEQRLHLLDGFLIAFLNIDEVIKIIRDAEHPKEALCKRFQLTELQAEAILEIKLRQLAKLEEIKIKAEQKELKDEQTKLQTLLNSEQKLTTLMMNEISEDSEKYGDARRAPLIERAPSVALSEAEVIPSEAVTVVLSEKGWIRAAKGHDISAENLNFKGGDQLLLSLPAKSNQSLTLLDSAGRAYTTPIHTLPSARGQGEPLTGRFNPPAGSKFISALIQEEKGFCLLASSKGYGFFAPIAELSSKNRNGKAILTVDETATALPPIFCTNFSDSFIAVATSEGYLLVFPASECPELNKGKGNKLINLPKKDPTVCVVSVSVFKKEDVLILHSAKRELKVKFSDLENYMGHRASRGNKLPRGFQKIDAITIKGIA